MRNRAVFIFFLLFLISLFQFVDAQFSVGVSGGITRMKFTGDPPGNNGFYVPNPGYAANLNLNYRVNDAVAVRTSPGFCVLRSKYAVLNDSATRVIDSTYFTMSNFSVPLHVIVWTKNRRFYVLSGIQLDYMLNFKGRTVLAPYSLETEINKYNFYAQFGAGFIIPVGKPFLSFEFLYSQGLSDLSKTSLSPDRYLPRTKLTNLHFNVGIHFPLGMYAEKYGVIKNQH